MMTTSTRTERPRWLGGVAATLLLLMGTAASATRWYVHESLALQLGVEYGEITTFGGGMRFDF